jgi:hypothetical protein
MDYIARMCGKKIFRSYLLLFDSTRLVQMHQRQLYIRRLEMEETTRKLTLVVLFLSVVVVTLFGLAPLA